MGDRVAFADVGEKLVAEALALRGAAHQAGDVDEGQPRRNDLLGAGDPGERRQARIRHRDVADIRLDGAERIIGRLRRRRLRQRVEQRRFAHIGQPDNAAFETHETRAREVAMMCGGLCGAAEKNARGGGRRGGAPETPLAASRGEAG